MVNIHEDVSDDEVLKRLDRMCDHHKWWKPWKWNSECTFYTATLKSVEYDED